MLKSEAMSIHANGHSHKFAVSVWEEGGKLVTQVDGKRHVARNVFEMETSLDRGECPSPRNVYFVDEPDYEE